MRTLVGRAALMVVAAASAPEGVVVISIENTHQNLPPIPPDLKAVAEEKPDVPWRPPVARARWER